ncbi:hypothetical protein F2Q69_00002555 [Brassica cretica]|uniref:Uncharacterized protein n=1 Tax=Brassica cretica TaxID=69181 RepID=A0A8S9NXW1_BRACR|nr:hypothetical protein F2Q69_00002555 [Brassica cretica]
MGRLFCLGWVWAYCLFSGPADSGSGSRIGLERGSELNVMLEIVGSLGNLGSGSRL